MGGFVCGVIFVCVDILGCQMQAAWPTMKCSLLVHVSESWLVLNIPLKILVCDLREGNVEGSTVKERNSDKS